MTAPPTGRSTWQRRAIEALLAQERDFLSARQIYQRAADHGENIALATVYRTVQLLAEQGQLDVLRTDSGESLYRHCRTGVHHHHLVCRSCGATVEIDGPSVEQWADQMGSQYGYTDVSHTLELFGTCAACAQNAVS